MNIRFTHPISGEFPCQAEGYILDTDEPFYFKQRGQRATFHVYDLPLSASLNKGLRPTLKAKYHAIVMPLNGDSEKFRPTVLATINSLLAMHLAKEHHLSDRNA